MTRTLFAAITLLGFVATGCGLAPDSTQPADSDIPTDSVPDGSDDRGTLDGDDGPGDRGTLGGDDGPGDDGPGGDEDGPGDDGPGDEDGPGDDGPGDDDPGDEDGPGDDDPGDESEGTCFVVSGNPTCEDLGLGSQLMRIDPPAPGSYTASGAAVSLLTDGTYLDFSSTVAVDAIILKAGDGAMVCTFDESVSTASDLHGPVNANNASPRDLSHVDLCVD